METIIHIVELIGILIGTGTVLVILTLALSDL